MGVGDLFADTLDPQFLQKFAFSSFSCPQFEQNIFANYLYF